LPIIEYEIPTEDGVTLYVRAVGSPFASSTIVAVNGGPGISHQYIESLDEFANSSRKIVYYDQRGTGRSSKPPADHWGLHWQVKDLAAVVQKHRNRREAAVYVLAFSWGTLIAIAHAVEHSQHLSGIMLVSSMAPSVRKQDEAWAQGAHAVEEQYRRIVDASGLGCEAYKRAMNPVYFANPAHPKANGFIASECEPSDPSAEIANALVEWDFRERLASLELPVLVVQADKDLFGSFGAEEIAEVMTSCPAQVVLLSGCGHRVLDECGSRLLLTMDDFLAHPMACAERRRRRPLSTPDAG
jgi:pimeloyl-ACP methyl ester carboxylesterase